MSHPPQDAYNLPLPFGLHRITQALNALGTLLIIGLMLLINIVLISVVSAPVPFRMFMNEPANTIVATFPAVWLPALLVPLAYFLHILSIKQLIRKRAGIPALG